MDTVLVMRKDLSGQRRAAALTVVVAGTTLDPAEPGLSPALCGQHRVCERTQALRVACVCPHLPPGSAFPQDENRLAHLCALGPPTGPQNNQCSLNRDQMHLSGPALRRRRP